MTLKSTKRQCEYYLDFHGTVRDYARTAGAGQDSPANFRAATPISVPSRPLRCTNPPISLCSYAAKPTTAPSHPLRCIRRSVSACFRAATPIPASPHPLRSSSTRHCMKHREAPSRIRIFGCKSGNYRLSKAQRP